MTGPDRVAVRTELEGLVRTGVAWGRTGPSSAGARRAAVLVLFGGSTDAAPDTSSHPANVDLLFVERAASLSHHPGQIAFPGGRLDPGDDGPIGAALREAEEETGLDPSGVEVLGSLGALPLAVSNHVVTPVLAWWARPSAIEAVDTAESAAVFRIPVARLLAPEHRRVAVVRRAGRSFDSPAFVVGSRMIWGFTGLVLDGLFDSLGWTQPWDRHEIDIPL